MSWNDARPTGPSSLSASVAAWAWPPLSSESERRERPGEDRMNDQTMTEIRWQHDDQGLVTLTMDASGSAANTMTEEFLADLGRAVDRLRAGVADGSVTGVVLTSAKKSFFAGGNVNDMLRATPADAPALTEH